MYKQTKKNPQTNKQNHHTPQAHKKYPNQTTKSYQILYRNSFSSQEKFISKIVHELN